MATKKNVTVETVDKTPVEKAIEAAVEAPVEKKVPAKRTRKAPAKEEVKVEEVKAEVKEQAKTPAKKTAAKKTTAKKAAAKELKCEIAVQFAGKSYTQEDLVKIAKDVWTYDLGQKEEDLVSVELYVKPEESKAYYVFNGEQTGSFLI